MSADKDKLDQLLNKAKDLVAKVEQAKAAQRQALTLPAPFAGLIASGQATLVVSDTQKDIVGKRLLLADDEAVYGEVQLSKAKPISLAEFRRRQKEHRIPDVERKAAWPKARRLFAYPVESVEPFSEPQKRAGKKRPSRGKTTQELAAAVHHKRRLTSKQVETLGANTATALFSEVRGLCTTLKLAAPPMADQTIELMEVSEEIADVLRGVGEAAEALEPEFDQLAKALRAPAPDQQDSVNPFILADDLLSALKKAEEVLPPKSKPGVLAKAAQQALTDFLELEPDFQEASRCPEPVTKQEAQQVEVVTEEATDVFDYDGIVLDTEVCICIVCGYGMIPPKGKKCEDLKCPSCENDMVLKPFRDLEADQKASIDITAAAKVEKAVWSTAFVNDLPDSAFLYIAPGGEKDGEGKTKPRSLRYFPVRDKNGKLDLPHLRNAIARIPQAKAPGLDAGKKKSLQERARRMLAEATKKDERGDEDRLIIELGDVGELPIDVEKALNCFSQFEGSERVLPAVLQMHFRGGAAHGDFRIQTGKDLVGYTLALQQADALDVEDRAAAAKLARSFAARGSEWNRSLAGPGGVFASLKQTHPAAWLKTDNMEFSPGSIGATADAAGFMMTMAKPRVSRGCATDNFHEYFLEKDKRLQGRLLFRHVLTKDEEGGDPRLEAGKRSRNFWRGMLAEDLVPHVVTTKAVRKGYIGPQGWSLLPPQLKAVVPPNMRYWEADSEKERKSVRKALVQERFFTRDNLKMVDGEIRKVVAKYYLYQPEIEANVGKREVEVDGETATASPMPHPAPPTASQDIQNRDDGQDKSETVEKSVAQLLVEAKKRIKLVKYYTVDKSEEAAEEEHFVLGEVLVPDEFDAQNDAYSEHDVRKAAHFFMEYGHRLGLMHERTLADNRIRILESYVAPIDMTIEGRDVKKGTWLLAARVVDDDLWQAVKDGRLTGWSIEGTAIAEEIS
jgi:rubrerythrin